MKTRPFAYNPSQSPISGTLQIGSLSIGDSPLDYSSKPGGITWWMGPDEMPGYVVANVYPSSNLPTPLGNIGTVKFWRSTSKSDSSFVELADSISNQLGGSGPFSNAADAKTWLTSANLWTSYPENVKQNLVVSLDSGNPLSYPLIGNTWYDLQNNNDATINPSGPLVLLDAADPLSYSSGSTWFDRSGVNNNGTINGANYDSSGYFDFDGSNDYISIPLVTSSNNNITIECWFNSDDVNQSGQMIIYNGSDLNANGYGLAINTESTTSGNIFVLYGGLVWIDTGVTASSNTWYHLSMTISGTTLRVYLNGSQIFTTTVSNPNTPTLHTEVGRNDYNAARYFNGKISIIKIWDRVLNSIDISSEWNRYKGRYGYGESTPANSPIYSSEFGGYLSFNDDFLEYSTIPNIGDLASWTIEVWFRINTSLTGKCSALVTNQFDLISKLNFSIGTNNFPANSNISVGFYNGSWRTTPGFVPVVGQWYQVVGTYDGSIIRQYVNGTANGGTLNYVGTPQSGGEIRMMRRWDDTLTSSNLIDGDLSIVRIYSSALDSSEVLQNYNSDKIRFGL